MDEQVSLSFRGVTILRNYHPWIPKPANRLILKLVIRGFLLFYGPRMVKTSNTKSSNNEGRLYQQRVHWGRPIVTSRIILIFLTPSPPIVTSFILSSFLGHDIIYRIVLSCKLCEAVFYLWSNWQQVSGTSLWVSCSFNYNKKI